MQILRGIGTINNVVWQGKQRLISASFYPITMIGAATADVLVERIRQSEFLTLIVDQSGTRNHARNV
jgi:hypothetical protein